MRHLQKLTLTTSLLRDLSEFNSSQAISRFLHRQVVDCGGIEHTKFPYGTTKEYALLMANFLAYYHSDAQSVCCQSKFAT